MTKTARRGKRVSYLDRTWNGYWMVLGLTPIRSIDVSELRTKMMDFLVRNPEHPLCCNLSDDGRRWLPVSESERERHVHDIIVASDALDAAQDDWYTALEEQRPPLDRRAPVKVVVGDQSLIVYVTHIAGDAVVASLFGVLMSLGDVEGLRPLGDSMGVPTVARIVLKEFRAHWREWRDHALSGRRSVPKKASSEESSIRIVPAETVTVGSVVSEDRCVDFRAWRADNHPDCTVSSLMASATYLALAAEGVPVRRDAVYTLVNLRRHLAKRQATRAGNLVKSVLIDTDLADPQRVGADLRGLVESARVAPALLVGVILDAIRPKAGPVSLADSGTVTMTFNSMMRNPGIEHIPWIDPQQIHYLTGSYPVGADNISVFACGIEGKIEFSASFNPNVLDRNAVQRALSRLHDMPALLAGLPFDNSADLHLSP